MEIVIVCVLQFICSQLQCLFLNNIQTFTTFDRNLAFSDVTKVNTAQKFPTDHLAISKECAMFKKLCKKRRRCVSPFLSYLRSWTSDTFCPLPFPKSTADQHCTLPGLVSLDLCLIVESIQIIRTPIPRF